MGAGLSSAWGNSWGLAWGNSWGSLAPIVVLDTHDGDVKRKKRWSAEQRVRQQRRSQIVKQWERIVEGRREEALEVAAPFIQPGTMVVDFDALLARIDVIERLHQLMIEIDDEDVLLLL